AHFSFQQPNKASPTAAWYSLSFPFRLGIALSRVSTKPKLREALTRAITSPSVDMTQPPSPIPKLFVAWRLNAVGMDPMNERESSMIQLSEAPASITTGTPERSRNASQSCCKTGLPNGATGMITPAWSRIGCSNILKASRVQLLGSTSTKYG